MSEAMDPFDNLEQYKRDARVDFWTEPARFGRFICKVTKLVIDQPGKTSGARKTYLDGEVIKVLPSPFDEMDGKVISNVIGTEYKVKTARVGDRGRFMSVLPAPTKQMETQMKRLATIGDVCRAGLPPEFSLAVDGEGNPVLDEDGNPKKLTLGELMKGPLSDTEIQEFVKDTVLFEVHVTADLDNWQTNEKAKKYDSPYVNCYLNPIPYRPSKGGDEG